MLARNINRNPYIEYKVAGYVDDYGDKIHLKLMDVLVLGTTKEIIAIVIDKDVIEFIFGIQSLSKPNMLMLYKLCTI